jgi:Zn-finger domain-containing protein
VENQGESFSVEVVMQISKKGKVVDTKKVDFGELKEAQVRGLADLFSMLASNVEYIKKLAPQFEKIDKTKPAYLQ